MTDPSLARQPTICPTCGAGLQPHAGFVTWCQACGWNAAPSGPEPVPEGRLERLEFRLAKAAGTHLFEQLRGRPITRPRWTLSQVVALLLAGVVHLVTLALVVFGVLLPVQNWPNPFAILAGVVALAIGWLLHPRLGRVPRDATSLRRETAPQLFALLDRVAIGAGSRPVDLVLLEPDFNAWHSVLGFRRRHVLGLGLPLWAALSPQENVAVLGHEFGHAVNGDVRRGLLIGSALGALAEWYHAFDTEGRDPILNLLLTPIRAAIAGLYLVEVKLLLHGSQRGEYLADAISARVGSTEAAVSALDRTMGIGSIMLGVRRAAYRPDAASTDLRKVVADRVAAIPAIEWARLRRAADASTHRVDSTHPPSRLRQQLMESRPPEPGTVRLDLDEVDAIERELDPYVPELQRQAYAEQTYVR